MYDEPLFRPPAEAFSLIVQISRGCPYNKCLFCPMYKSKKYSVVSEEQLQLHLENLKVVYVDQSRAFLADGDSLYMKTDILLSFIERIKDTFPRLRHFGIYGSVFSLRNKSIGDLVKLKDAGLRYLYLGIESGDDKVLKLMKKDTIARETVEACLKVKKAGIKLSVMVILGLGGKKYSQSHAKKSAEVINAITPNYTNFLDLMTEHTIFIDDPEFTDSNLLIYFKELRIMVENINCKTVFRSNHTSNFVPLSGRLPNDKKKFLKAIQIAQKNFPKKSDRKVHL